MKSIKSIFYLKLIDMQVFLGGVEIRIITYMSNDGKYINLSGARGRTRTGTGVTPEGF